MTTLTDPPQLVDTPFELITRDEVWPGLDPTNYYGGGARPLLLANRPYLTVHYTGAGHWADEGDTVVEVRSIQTWAASAAKRTPWEYNWIIDSEGHVVEYAGFYQAAHSAGENSIAIGVLMLLGPSEAPTAAQILAFRQLRWWLQAVRSLASSHQMRGHYQMPGAQTTCPGDLVRAAWPQLSQPWLPPVKPPINYGQEINVGLFMAEPPVVVLDTREGGNKILADGKWFPVTIPGLPADAKSVIVNITSTQQDGKGYIESADPQYAGLTDLNFVPGVDVTSPTLVGVEAGKIRLRVHGAATHVIVGLRAYCT